MGRLCIRTKSISTRRHEVPFSNDKDCMGNNANWESVYHPSNKWYNLNNDFCFHCFAYIDSKRDIIIPISPLCWSHCADRACNHGSQWLGVWNIRIYRNCSCYRTFCRLCCSFISSIYALTVFIKTWKNETSLYRYGTKYFQWNVDNFWIWFHAFWRLNDCILKICGSYYVNNYFLIFWFNGAFWSNYAYHWTRIERIKWR